MTLHSIVGKTDQIKGKYLLNILHNFNFDKLKVFKIWENMGNE